MKARYWFILAIITGLVGLIGLRANAQHALLLKNQILEKDQASVDVTNDINGLKTFIFHHMNTTTTLELTASYTRAVQAAQAGGATGQLYAQAQAACDHQGVGSVLQAHCVEDFLNQQLGHPTPGLPLEVNYRYAFASPGWSPDLAGFSLLATTLLSVVALSTYVISLVKTSSN